VAWSHTSATAAGSLECQPLTPERFRDLETVFGERGVARRCFCMHWRRPDGGHQDDLDNKDRYAAVVAAGPPPGLVGYIGDEPLGWVQVGPRSHFPTIGRSRLLKPVDDAEVWSINCFVVRVRHRTQGIGRGMLVAAIQFAKEHGAMAVEAYPVDGERASVVDYFTGTLGMFEDEGFVELIRRNETRPIVRLTF
jgi:GNAT superfamily N-acetyltransferase